MSNRRAINEDGGAAHSAVIHEGARHLTTDSLEGLLHSLLIGHHLHRMLKSADVEATHVAHECCSRQPRSMRVPAVA